MALHILNVAMTRNTQSDVMPREVTDIEAFGLGLIEEDEEA